MSDHPMFQTVCWLPIHKTRDVKPGELYATHEGTLELSGFRFKVFQLSDGQRVIDAGDVETFFAGMTFGEPTP